MPKENTVETVPARIRLNLEYPAAIHAQMQIVQQRSHAASITEMLRHAVALYDLITEHISEGGQVILRNEKGEEEKLRIL
jgi:hypothetical protein